MRNLAKITPNPVQIGRVADGGFYDPPPVQIQTGARPAPAPVTVREAARHFGVDPATVRRWIKKKEFPCLRSGRRGPGLGALLDLAAVETYLATRRGVAGLSADEALQRIAGTLLETVEKEHVDICVGISREASAAALLVVWRCCCRNFGRTYRLDEQPKAIRALMPLL